MHLQAFFALILIHCALSFEECSNHNYLEEGDRAVGNTNQSPLECDRSLKEGWYRFRGNAGNEMASSCPPKLRCGTHAPGWLNGSHPSVAEGAVQRQVCFHWSTGCCQWEINIQVRNCSGFYVYRLKAPPACSLRYCGNRQAPVSSTSRPTTMRPTPTSYSECSNYRFLNESNRAKTYNKPSPLICDSSLSGWYRFGGEAGSKMPESCVKERHCGTHAPGWLNGSHPTMADGAVKRKVCFHWSSSCCRWSTMIDVRNCGGFYVYKLYRPPACTLRYCGNGLPPAPECSNYNTLEERDRAVGNTNRSPIKCDSSLKEGWYRFRGNAGNEMPSSCPEKQRCGTHAPGWLNGSHPSVAVGAVQRQVCFHWSSGCCQWKSNIQVRNCSGFYVYRLKAPPACSLRYCGNRQAPVSSTSRPTTMRPTPTSYSECSNYRFLNESNRAKTYNKPSPLICDSSLSGWYRFGGEAGSKMPESCVKERHCGTHAPGWLNGSHPTMADGAVKRKVCFHWSSSCCRWSTMIDVRNCGGFYVYKLYRPPACTLRYCGNGLPPAPECSNYNTLEEGDRAVGNTNRSSIKCDSSLKEGWYRFRGNAGNEMPSSCPEKQRCGTHAPGWLNGSHPSAAEGAVQRQVCFHWSSGCCQWKSNIQVRNCSGFYVYRLKAPPACSLRYCGNRQAPVSSTPRPTTMRPTPTSYSECSNYRFLNESNRAKTYNKPSPYICDSSLSGWYRFGGEAGSQMPESCVKKRHCGTHAPGWLDGSHPTMADGAVKRKVCFHWSDNCCRWSTMIDVRNCGGFYVYKLHRPPACTLRYCGNGIPSARECSNYTYLEEGDRAVGNSNKRPIKCDRSLREGWYRFRGNAGNEMASSCPPKQRCGTRAPGWLNGSHPSVAEGTVQRQVCFHWSTGCCQWESNTQVRNCSGFYVYRLKAPPACSLRYCGNRQAPVSSTPRPTTMRPTPTSYSECSNYRFLNESNRAKTYNKPSPYICDSSLSGWYRFGGEAGSQMPESCVKKRHCGTHAPGWLDGSHPTMADGAVKRKVCFHWSDNCCRWSTMIDVRNCGGFYVYKLHRPPACTLRYCGNGLPPAPECSNYNYLEEGDRAVGNTNRRPIKCDRSLKEGWYRFRGSAGNKMASSCPPKLRCGTHAPGWLNGSHPSVAEGAVQRRVCFHWSSGCCQWENHIQVRNCSGYYVYQLKPTRFCSLRYCGNREAPRPSTPTPLTPTPTRARPIPTSYAACSNYRFLNESNRAKTYNKPSPYICDSSLSGWYRFGGEAGSQMPESCVKERHCGTHAPGWLNGSHPTVADGAVKRKVCFHWSKRCCRWSTVIEVRNCGGFYVYKLHRPPACTLRYCGNGLSPTTASTPTSKPTIQPSPTRPNHGFMILCLPVAMKVNISRNLLPPSMDPSLLHLNDPGCGALHVDQKYVVMETPLKGCGTVRRSIGRTVLFHNRVVVPSAYGRKRTLLEFPFACTYNEFGFPGIINRPALFHKRGHAMDSTSDDRTVPWNSEAYEWV
ncbi:LOW QUALITY PROTEIN: uncharacterized protein LOC144642166 [Oculina patagonica]